MSVTVFYSRRNDVTRDGGANRNVLLTASENPACMGMIRGVRTASISRTLAAIKISPLAHRDNFRSDNTRELVEPTGRRNTSYAFSVTKLHCMSGRPRSCSPAHYESDKSRVLILPVVIP